MYILNLKSWAYILNFFQNPDLLLTSISIT